MIKKTVKYTDFEGVEVIEDCYFHVTKQEAVTMAAEGVQEKLTAIAESGDPKLIMTTFEDIILNAYGRKSQDGRGFIKNETIREEFKNSLAFEEIFTELILDAHAASAFISAIIPTIDPNANH